jgi:adenylate cyclase class 2
MLEPSPYTSRMTSAEIEVKVPVPDLTRFERQLAQAGFHLDTPRTFEQNTLYDTPDRALKARGEILRVREYGGRHVVTHKRHPDEEDNASMYKVRIETESEVSDGDALAEIFTRLGFGPAFRYEKYRSEYSHPDSPGAHLVLDETPIGNFAELEGPTGWIDRTLARLGIDPASCLTESYGKLFLAWKERTHSPANNLTFDEIGAPVLVP